MEEIVNKVANSALMVFDLEDYYQDGIRTQLDISQWLLEGFLLKEKDFREALKTFDWAQFTNHFVAIDCTTDAILPTWAPILVASYVSIYAKKTVLGTLEDLENSLYQDALVSIDFSEYTDKPVILKGCSKKPVPSGAYILAVAALQKTAKSVMYGEACSAVPIYKSKR